MIKSHQRVAYFMSLIALVLLIACGEEKSSNPEPEEGPASVPDFSLPDLNPNSEKYLHAISPRAYAGKISCWYFGAAT